MNAEIWKQVISEGEAPDYPCPHCGRGLLVLDPDSLTAHETEDSRRAHPDDRWDPDQAHYAFSCWLKCSAPRCGGLIAVVGEGFEEPEWDEERGQMWVRAYRPRFAWPMPSIFTVPEGCPASVARQLTKSFEALWNDPAAAAARLRTALERLLDSLGIAKRRTTKKGGYERLTLHQRLVVLEKHEKETAANLMGVKWLGNTGTHEEQVSVDDVLKGYEVMEHSLEALLKLRAKRAKALAKELTRRHRRRR